MASQKITLLYLQICGFLVFRKTINSACVVKAKIKLYERLVHANKYDCHAVRLLRVNQSIIYNQVQA